MDTAHDTHIADTLVQTLISTPTCLRHLKALCHRDARGQPRERLGALQPPRQWQDMAHLFTTHVLQRHGLHGSFCQRSQQQIYIRILAGDRSLAWSAAQRIDGLSSW
jgi:hypothetical protein